MMVAPKVMGAVGCGFYFLQMGNAHSLEPIAGK
jgi:hypothetical protein